MKLYGPVPAAVSVPSLAPPPERIAPLAAHARSVSSVEPAAHAAEEEAGKTRAAREELTDD